MTFLQRMSSLAFLVVFAVLTITGCSGSSASTPPPTPTPMPSPSPNPTPTPTLQNSVNHVLIMMQENRSFDHYFGFMTQYRQKNNIPINSSDGKIRDLSDPAAQAAANSNISPATGQPITPYHTGSVCTEDLTPDWADSHVQMDQNNPAAAGPGSPMDGFVADAFGIGQSLGPGVLADTTGHRAMGIFDDSQLNFYYATASNFAMSDAFYSPVPTRTSSNRLYIHAATSHGTVHAETSVTAQLPSKTIWRALSEANLTWKIYISDWGVNNFTYFQFFSDFNSFTQNVVPISQYFTDVQNGTLPSVAFIETGMNTGRDEHPTNNPTNAPVPISQAINVQAGAEWSAQIINALMFSPSWKDSAFFWMFDEGGGAFDHEPPISVPNPDGIKPTDFDTTKDCFGQPCSSFDFNITGFRVPNFIVSPFAKKNYVSHTPMDYTAILKFIETRFNLPPLTNRDASMPDMTEFFDFTNGGPWATPPAKVTQTGGAVCDFTKE
jgi:phospholipase C